MASRKLFKMLAPERSALFLCDIQVGFRPIIYNAETVINKSRLMKKTADIMVISL
jgi:hypothetical protein